MVAVHLICLMFVWVSKFMIVLVIKVILKTGFDFKDQTNPIWVILYITPLFLNHTYIKFVQPIKYHPIDQQIKQIFPI